MPKVNHNPEVILSEVLFNLGNRTSYIELTYLGSENSYDISGYKIICDSVFTIPSCTLSSERDKYILKASQFPSGFDLSPQSDNVYLYSDNGELLDMVGWNTSHSVDKTVSRVPDGFGSYQGFDDLSSVNAGWQFDCSPTMAMVCIGPDQTKICDLGGKIYYNLSIANSAQTDVIDINYVSTPNKCNFNFYFSSNMTLLTDTDNDNLIDTGVLAPNQILKLRLEVIIPYDACIGTVEKTTIYAFSSIDAEISDHVFLETYTYPHLEASQSVFPTNIYHKEISGMNQTTVKLNVAGFGAYLSIKIPQDTIFLMDSSGSMVNSDPLNIRIEASKRYTDKLTPPDRAAVVDFDDDAFLVNDDHLSSNYAKIKQNLDLIDSSGDTKIGQALKVGNDELEAYGDPYHEWIQILLSDGTSLDYADIFAQIQRAVNLSIRIFTIGLGDEADIWLLNIIAKMTGGEFFFAPTPGTLDSIYEAISIEIYNLAGKDLNVSDKDTMIKYVLPNYIDYVPGSSFPAPDYIEPGSNGTTELYWNIQRINLKEYEEITFRITSSKIGYVPICIYPDSRINYTTWNNTNKFMPFPQKYIWVEDVTPLPVRLFTNSDDNHTYLNWTEPTSLNPKCYLIYRAINQTGFDFSNPFANTYTNKNPISGTVEPLSRTWVDSWSNAPTNPNYSNEYYYCVVVINIFDMKSVTSNIAGKWTVEFHKGVNTFSLPLEPFEVLNISWYQNNISNCEYIKWMDPMNHNWVKHSEIDPEGVNDTVALIGEGYELYLNESIHYTFCGLPATSVRYIADKLPAPTGFSVDVVGNDVHLIWQPVAEADYYFIYRTNSRLGFNQPLVTPIAQLQANSGTKFVDTNVISKDCEYYYSIASVKSDQLEDYALNMGYSIGLKSMTYQVGYSTLALPLKPNLDFTAYWFCTNLEGTLGVNWLNENGIWLGHADWMPEGVYDTEIEMAKGYQICVEYDSDVKFIYIGI
ncbi:MAG: VWA domain-containing protein [Thermoplasmata archaeon]|nr:MAG: VWA domain-containing protein [Thermoplasmata archaeon]